MNSTLSRRTDAARRRAAAIAGAGLLLALAPAAAHAGTLDQDTGAPGVEQTKLGDFSPDGGTTSLAQTFTAGVTGALDRVDLHLAPQLPAVAPISVEIRNVVDDKPGTTVLASASIPSASVPLSAGYVPVQFAAPAAVAVGGRYAVVAYTAEGTGYFWSMSHTGSVGYIGGEAFFSALTPTTTWPPLDGDLALRTYVEPPVPKADLSVSMIGPATATSKQQVTYLLTVRNAGPSTATNVVLTDKLPFGVQFTAVTPSQGSCTPPGKGGTDVVCRLGDLASGGESDSAVTMKITARASNANINNVASVSSDVLDPNLSNNSTSITTKVGK